MHAASPTPEEVDQAAQALDGVRSQWLARPGVTGLDVGLSDDPSGLAIRVFVKQKRARNDLPAHEVFPDQLGGFPVEIVEATFEPQE